MCLITDVSSVNLLVVFIFYTAIAAHNTCSSRKILNIIVERINFCENMNETTVKMDIDGSLQEGGELSYEDKLNYVNAIAKPMASRKLTKKIYKCIKKASKHKTYLRNGLKDVQKHIRKGETGIVVFAGDVFPIEIMCHLPIVCEDKNIPYCYTPSKQDIGIAMGVKRGSLMVLIKEHPEYKELYDELAAAMKILAVPL